MQHWVDFGRIRSWFKECDKRGCPAQSQIKSPSLPRGFRLIDVQKCCLVESFPATTEYVALSYTWGQLQRPFLRTLKSNVRELSQKGALLPDNSLLPHTIRDAIVAVRAMGKRYLWVDSLCIVQDDVEDKKQQISCMSDIYTSADLTTVSGFGSDADAGLPGVPPTKRSGQLVVQVGEWTLANRLASPKEALENAWWNSRAWTYQEAALSRRLLVFSESQVHLVCRDHAPCSEECREIGFSYGISVLSLSLNVGLTSFDNYMNAVASYTTRNLSYEADALDAFAGVAASLSFSLRSNFCFNIPDKYFDHAVLWHPKNTIYRRKESGRPLFPSWTWSGWSGEILYDYPYRLSSRLLFLACPNKNEPLPVRPEFSSEDILPPTGWNEWEDWTRLGPSGYWRNTKVRSDYLHLHPLRSETNDQPMALSVDPAGGLIKFWTQVVFLRLTKQPLPQDFAFDDLRDHEYSVSMYSFTFGTWLSIVDSTGEVIGCVDINVMTQDLALDEVQPLILLSRTVRERGGNYGPKDYNFAPTDFEPGTPWYQRQFDYDWLSLNDTREGPAVSEGRDACPWDVYNVMLLDVIEGVSSRRGIGKIWMKDFHKAQPSRVQISLG